MHFIVSEVVLSPPGSSASTETALPWGKHLKFEALPRNQETVRLGTVKVRSGVGTLRGGTVRFSPPFPSHVIEGLLPPRDFADPPGWVVIPWVGSSFRARAVEAYALPAALVL